MNMTIWMRRFSLKLYVAGENRVSNKGKNAGKNDRYASLNYTFTHALQASAAGNPVDDAGGHIGKRHQIAEHEAGPAP